MTMSQTLTHLLEESIQLEKNLARLYALFSDHFTDDEDFWWQLSMEERGHAALLQEEKKQPWQLQCFPGDILAKDIEALRANNARIVEQTERFALSPFSREEALNLALQIEMSAGEAHFQDFLDSESDSLMADFFKQLASEDQNHARRIREYMNELGIEALKIE